MLKTSFYCCASALLVGSLTSNLRAASGVLDFNSAGGTILDSTGAGTGFTTRLTGTGASIPANSPNLILNTAGGVLNMKAAPGDFNGQAGMATTDAIGLKLSAFGYTGAEDFSVTAVFKDIPDNTLISVPDQLCVFVGTSSTNMTRVGFINFDNFLDPGETRSNEGFGVNTNGTNDSSPRFFGADVGPEMTVVVSRTGGVWAMTVDGVDRLPNANADGTGAPAPPLFLNAASDLIVGVVASDVGPPENWTANIDSFAVNVVPEPASLGLITAGSLLVLRRRRA